MVAEDLPSPNFKLLFESTPGLYLVLTRDFKIVAVSNAYLNATLTTRNQILGRGLFEVFPDNPNDPNATGVANLKASLNRVLQNHVADTMAVQKYDIKKPGQKDFEDRYWSPVNTPILDDSGEVLYIIHRVEDVTDFIRLKQEGSERSKLTEELRSKVETTETEVYLRAQQIQQANLELERLYAKVKEMDTVKTQFFANVSHELRTPLTLILGHLDRLLSTENFNDRVAHDLGVAERNSRILLRRVNDLLDIVKIESGKISPKLAPIDLTVFLRMIEDSFGMLAHDRNIQFRVLSPEHLPIQGDSEMIQKILLNLVGNAFKFVPDAGEIRIEARQKNGKAIIEVLDNGPGIPPHLIETIFERFRQGDGGTTRRFGGTGLGLAIAKEFAELHDGTLTASPSKLGGAAFRLELPASTLKTQTAGPEKKIFSEFARLASSELENISPKTDYASNPALKSGRVLVVEDNLEMNQYIAESLIRDFNVSVAFNGREAIEKIAASPPDVIVSDIMMPEMSGDEIVTRIRKNPEWADIPILLVTAKADERLKTGLLALGAQDYVLKPFSPDELVARVRVQFTLKQARGLLQKELNTSQGDIQRLAERLAEKKRKLESALHEAEKLSRIKTNFLNLISHETRTPLNLMQLQLYTLKTELSEKLEPFHQKLIDNLSHTSRRLLNLMDSLLSYAKVQSGRFVLNPVDLDLSELLSEMIGEVSSLAQEKKLKIKLELNSNSPKNIRTDRNLIQLALMNLLVNAIKYTDTGEITVSAEKTNDESSRISIRDTGPGIAQENHSVIFEPFEQLEGVSKKHSTGVGLGLPITKGLLSALGGRIELVSNPGDGSTFSAVLPPSPPETQEETEWMSTAKPS